jgi:hypothetical protein
MRDLYVILAPPKDGFAAKENTILLQVILFSHLSVMKDTSSSKIKTISTNASKKFKKITAKN